MNEFALIFDKIGINTKQVLEASKTKWNFLPFKPGLVGGHCIGVDPYYLTHKAEKLGYTPQVILAGRRLNDEMGKFIAKQAIKKIIAAGNNILKSSVTVLGVTFKENCPDIRNSKVIDIIEELKEFGIKVTPHDPCADHSECKKEYGVNLSDFNKLTPASCVIISVEHDQYKKLPIKTLFSLVKKNGVIIDVKGIFDPDKIVKAGYTYWSL
jgi:UDP-N-acetyl-D-galactosamine dehydrogenase